MTSNSPVRWPIDVMSAIAAPFSAPSILASKRSSFAPSNGSVRIYASRAIFTAALAAPAEAGHERGGARAPVLVRLAELRGEVALLERDREQDVPGHDRGEEQVPHRERRRRPEGDRSSRRRAGGGSSGTGSASRNASRCRSCPWRAGTPGAARTGRSGRSGRSSTGRSP